MSNRNGIPTFVHLALTSASTEVRRVAQLTAELPDHDRRIKELREAYAQEKADAEKALSARAAEVDAAVKEREGIVGALGEAQENAQGGQDMVRLWCQANNRPVPEMPDLRDLTMPFQSVAPASGPVQPVPDRSAVACKCAKHGDHAGCDLGCECYQDDDPTEWTAPSGVRWDLTCQYRDPSGFLWHWAGGFEDRGRGVQPLMSRNDWTANDVPLIDCPPLSVYVAPVSPDAQPTQTEGGTDHG